MNPLPLYPFSAGFTHRRKQQGVAAVEFSLIAIFMIVLLLGLLVWWHYFQASQILTRAAGDGARAAYTLAITGTTPCLSANADANKTYIEVKVESIIKNQLIYSGLSDSRFSISNSSWTCPSSETEESSSGRIDGSFSFDVHYQLPSLLGETHWLTEPSSLNIKDKIIVHFPSRT